MSARVIGTWHSQVSASTAKASWGELSPPLLRLIFHIRGAVGGLHHLGRDTMLLGVTDRPRPGSEYTFNKHSSREDQ